MRLAKDRIDVGLFAVRLEPLLAFWQGEIGLKFDHLLPLGDGLRQHRHDLAGSVLKINEAREALPQNPPSGYRELVIARAGLSGPHTLQDPDGNRVMLVPPGHFGIGRIGVRLGVRDIAAHRHFYSHVLGLAPVAGVADAFACGDSVLMVEHDLHAPEAAEMTGPGYRYITIQVWNTNEAHGGILARGGWEGRPPETLGDIARISFVRDPDGNWIEISQRASLTGTLEPG